MHWQGFLEKNVQYFSIDTFSHTSTTSELHVLMYFETHASPRKTYTVIKLNCVYIFKLSEYYRKCIGNIIRGIRCSLKTTINLKNLIIPQDNRRVESLAGNVTSRGICRHFFIVSLALKTLTKYNVLILVLSCSGQVVVSWC